MALLRHIVGQHESASLMRVPRAEVEVDRDGYAGRSARMVGRILSQEEEEEEVVV